MAKDTCAPLEEQTINQCRYTMAKTPCGLGLANTASNAPATQEIWNLGTPTPLIHIRA